MSDIKKVRDYKKSRQPKPPISKAAHRANSEHIVDDLLMPIIEKMMANPADIQPVSESFEDLLFEMRNGVKRQPFIVQAAGRRLAVCDDVVTEFEYQPNSGDGEIIAPAITFPPTKNITGGDTENDSSINTGTFTEAELLILEQFKK